MIFFKPTEIHDYIMVKRKNKERSRVGLSREMQIGKAGEYLVCADLIMKGFVAYPSEQGLQYDVVLDTGKKLLKIQVKTTSTTRKIPSQFKVSMAYLFDIRRAGKFHKKIHNIRNINLFAFVCLDTRQVAYMKPRTAPYAIILRADALRGTYYDEKGIADYESAKILKKQGLNNNEIAEKLNIHFSTVSKILQPKYKPFKSKRKYFSELERDRTWFLKP